VKARSPARREGRPLFRSLRLRIALSHGLVLALIVFVLGTVGYVLLSASLNHQATNAVRAAAQEQTDRVGESGPAVGPPDKDAPSSAAIRTAVFLPDGQIAGEQGDVPSWLRPQPSPITTIRAHNEDVRVATIVLRQGGRIVATAVAGKSLAPETALLRQVRLLLIGGGLAGFLASMLAGWILSGRAARPVRRAYEAQAAFAADASHELRTPLAFVQSGVEVLAQTDPQLGSEVLREIGYLTSITERLLALARTPGDRSELELHPVQVESVCRQAARRSERALGLCVSLDLGDSAVALADPVALEAALDAVLENVAQHGGGKATLGVARNKGGIVVSVADRGQGLSPEMRERAFERFVRADPARTRANGGAGLGLPLARSLVEAQHGRMWLDETPGGGLTACIQLEAPVGR
jgi:signal transduction histidine kinase